MLCKTRPPAAPLLPRASVTQRQEREARAQIRVPFEQLLVAVHPRAVVPLPARQFIGQFPPPGVPAALIVLDLVVAIPIESLGEGVIVVVQSGAPLARMALQVPILADPFD